MTLTEVLLSCARKHRVKAFNAAFEAEYPGRVTPGTIAKFEPVLQQAIRNLSLKW